jgi:hypothetical protein
MLPGSLRCGARNGAQALFYRRKVVGQTIAFGGLPPSRGQTT